MQYKTRKGSVRGSNTVIGETCARCNTNVRYIATGHCWACQQTRNKARFQTPEARAIYNAQQAAQYHDEDRIWKVLIDSSKGRAAKKNWEYNLVLADLPEKWEQQCGLCYYTGVPMEKVSGSKRHFNILRVSLDRIDSAQGYTKENVILCTGWANIAKHHCSGEFFEMLCRCVVTQYEIRRLAANRDFNLADAFAMVPEEPIAIKES